jgi:hypothetical protein
VTVIGAFATPAIVAAGATEQLAATIVTNAPLANAIVDFEVYTVEGVKVFQRFWPNADKPSPVNFVAHAPRTFRAAWHVPAGQTSDTFTFKVGIFGPGWKHQYAWNNAAATFTLGALLVVRVISAAAAPAIVAAGATEQLAATIDTNVSLGNAVVDFEIYNAEGAKAFQQVWPNTASPGPVNLIAHTPRSFHVTWHVPAGQAAGAYTFKFGIFGAGWAPQFVWDDAAAIFWIR